MQLKSTVLCEKVNSRYGKEISERMKKLEIESKVHDETDNDWLFDMTSADFLVVIVSGRIYSTNLFSQMGYAEGKQGKHKLIFFVQIPGCAEPHENFTIQEMYYIEDVNDPAMQYLCPHLRAFVALLLADNFKIEVTSRDLRDVLLGYHYQDTNTKLIQACQTGVGK
jgi:hypothetical protein